MAVTRGFEQLDKRLRKMSAAVGGKILRSTAMTATLPSKKAIESAAPVGSPPYTTADGRQKDPYPVRTYKGRLRTPGFASRNIVRKSRLSPDKKTATVRIGVAAEAFYAVQFIELGTSKIPARPWLEPAFRGSIPQLDRRFREQLKKKIDKAARS